MIQLSRATIPQLEEELRKRKDIVQIMENSPTVEFYEKEKDALDHLKTEVDYLTKGIDGSVAIGNITLKFHMKWFSPSDEKVEVNTCEFIPNNRDEGTLFLLEYLGQLYVTPRMVALKEIKAQMKPLQKRIDAVLVEYERIDKEYGLNVFDFIGY